MVRFFLGLSKTLGAPQFVALLPDALFYILSDLFHK